MFQRKIWYDIYSKNVSSTSIVYNIFRLKEAFKKEYKEINAFEIWEHII